MERAELEQLERVIDREIKIRFPRDTVQRVVVRQHGDEPAIEPGELLVRVFIPAPESPGDYAQSLAAWEEEHGIRMQQNPAGTLTAAPPSQAAGVHLRRPRRRDSPDHDA